MFPMYSVPVVLAAIGSVGRAFAVHHLGKAMLGVFTPEQLAQPRYPTPCAQGTNVLLKTFTKPQVLEKHKAINL